MLGESIAPPTRNELEPIMSKAFAFLPFVLLTIICWGNYGVLMHHGKELMGDALRPFVGVGFAYFAIAVLVPTALLAIKGEKGNWSRSGVILSLLAGAVGALGALGVILAFSFKAKPIYVMPLVFGGAPVINTLVTMAMSQNLEKIKPIFLIGILMAALGGAGVLVFKPSESAKPAKAAEMVGVDTSETITTTAPVETELNFPMVAFSVALAVLSWGAYGPVLHKGQMKMGGSRLRPFLCVGIAYFFIAVAIPLLVLPLLESSGQWNSSGMAWSLAGGAAGAIGALGIIYAFNFGGKPIFVMPLIFGMAPVMNTFTTLTENASWGRIEPTFIVALLVTIAGAVTVLIFAPKPAPAPKPSAAVH
jgi:hypothetical protein